MWKKSIFVYGVNGFWHFTLLYWECMSAMTNLHQNAETVHTVVSNVMMVTLAYGDHGNDSLAETYLFTLCDQLWRQSLSKCLPWLFFGPSEQTHSLLGWFCCIFGYILDSGHTYIVPVSSELPPATSESAVPLGLQVKSPVPGFHRRPADIMKSPECQPQCTGRHTQCALPVTKDYTSAASCSRPTRLWNLQPLIWEDPFKEYTYQLKVSLKQKRAVAKRNTWQSLLVPPK